MEDKINNGWSDYSRHVLKELERLNLGQDRTAEKIQELRDSLDSKLNSALASIREDLNSLQNKVAYFDPNKVVQLGVEVDNMKSERRDSLVMVLDRIEKSEGKIRALELSQSSFGGKWTIISAIGAVVLSATISMVFSMAKAEPPKAEKPVAAKVAEP